jgi:hypothetical protein
MERWMVKIERKDVEWKNVMQIIDKEVVVAWL